MSASIETSCFSHNWTAEILTQRPMILPSRHYTYPATVEEVERGALEILIQPILIPPALPSSVAPDKAMKPLAQPFLATCALGFRDAAAPTGLWSCPDPNWICAVSGGYAYLIDVENPERFTFLRYRPVLEILPYSVDLPKSEHDRLLLFIGHHSILAWGKDGEAWESDRLSSEGITNLHINGKTLRGEGWDLMTDKDLPFALDLETGKSFSIDQ
jgi:hypothetical protein